MFDKDTILWRFKQDKSGLEFAYTDEILQEYQNLFSKIFPNINLEPHTPQGQIITHLVEQDIATISAMQDTLNYFFLGGQNTMLDVWAYNQYRATRKKGVNGTCLIELQGVPNTPIKKGLIVSDNKNKFYLENDVMLDFKGKASAVFVAQEANDNISLANTLTQIETPQVGLEKVNNPAPSQAGSAIENDTDFYLRCQTYGSLFKNSSFASILANVAQVQGVGKIGGFENYSDEEVTELGVTIPPHFFIIIVQGGDDKTIAETIASAKPPGAGMIGDVTITLTINDKEIDYKFSRPKLAPLKVSVSCDLNLNSPSAYAQFVRDAVANYISSLNIGAIITQPNLSQAIVKGISGFKIKDVKIGRADGATDYAPIVLNLDELASIAPENIIVTAD